MVTVRQGTGGQSFDLYRHHEAGINARWAIVGYVPGANLAKCLGWLERYYPTASVHISADDVAAYAEAVEHFPEWHIPTTCHFCGAGRDADRTTEADRMSVGLYVNSNHWFGDHYDRVNVCGRPGCRKAIASAPRRPRRPRTPQPLYGDFAYLAAFNGIATDGTGRKAGTR